VDAIRCSDYEGEVLRDEVLSLIEAHNAVIKGTTLADRQQRIGIWQHERVVALIISNLGLVPKIRTVCIT
jgi:hypothetical protein